MRALRELEERREAAIVDQATRRAAKQEAREFESAVREFVEAWNRFAAEYRERGAFNLKKAKAVSDAWRRIEKQQGWPR